MKFKFDEKTLRQIQNTKNLHLFSPLFQQHSQSILLCPDAVYIEQVQASINKLLPEMPRAKVIEAEAQIPLAVAEALKEGNLGLMDYYKLENIKADTKMRDSIGGGDKK